MRYKAVKFLFTCGFTRRALSCCTDDIFRAIYRKVSHVKTEIESGSRSSRFDDFRGSRRWTA
jgi:hypothetical protein